MSTLVCRKRGFYEDLSTPHLYKRHRCSSAYTPPPLSDQLPNMDKQNISRVLEEAGKDLDATVTVKNLEKEGTLNCSAETSFSEDPSDLSNLSKTGPEWVELIVTQMTKSSNMDDARIRASRVLGVLEKSIKINASAQGKESLQMENKALKEQVEELVRDNTILKKAVVVLHTQQQNEKNNLELQQLKQLVSQYKEHVRTLELNNYALSLHLRQAELGSSMPSRFNPDVF